MANEYHITHKPQTVSADDLEIGEWGVSTTSDGSQNLMFGHIIFRALSGVLNMSRDGSELVKPDNVRCILIVPGDDLHITVYTPEQARKVKEVAHD